MYFGKLGFYPKPDGNCKCLYPQCDHGLDHTYCESGSCNGAKVKADEIIDHYMRLDLQSMLCIESDYPEGRLMSLENHFVVKN